MEFDVRILLFGPILMFGVMTMVLIAVVLALTRNRWRLCVGLLGAVTGYIALGTKYARELAADACRRGACPDAGWFGPSKGAIVGALIGVVAYEVLGRCLRRSNKVTSTRVT